MEASGGREWAYRHNCRRECGVVVVVESHSIMSTRMHRASSIPTSRRQRQGTAPAVPLANGCSAVSHPLARFPFGPRASPPLPPTTPRTASSEQRYQDDCHGRQLRSLHPRHQSEYHSGHDRCLEASCQGIEVQDSTHIRALLLTAHTTLAKSSLARLTLNILQHRPASRQSTTKMMRPCQLSTVCPSSSKS